MRVAVSAVWTVSAAPKLTAAASDAGLPYCVLHDLIGENGGHEHQHKDQGPEQDGFRCGSHMRPPVGKPFVVNLLTARAGFKGRGMRWRLISISSNIAHALAVANSL